MIRSQRESEQIREVTGARSQGGKPSGKPLEVRIRARESYQSRRSISEQEKHIEARVAIGNHRETTGNPKIQRKQWRSHIGNITYA